jgi:tetratricopeptide (TPR) repeat protein
LLSVRAMTSTIRVMSLILAVFGAGAGPGVASPPDDPVLAGYQRYYRGDTEGAREDFQRLVAANPQGLPARFGLLEVLNHEPGTQAEFERLIDQFIADAEARYGRTDKDEEALFYLANAYMVRAAYRFDHDKGMWGAARDGARSKRLSDAYVKRHPEHGDAYFALGMYNYYVEVAPAFVKLIRPLLFLPAGDRAGGLKQLERAYTEGSLFSYQAGMTLTEIYGSLEGRPADGVRVGEQLARTYPDNPEIQFELAELYLGPAVEDPGRAAVQYEKVIAAETRRAAPRAALYRAQFGLASALVEQWRLDDAIAVLTSTIERNPARPAWVVPGFILRRANYRALLGDAAAADEANRVLAEPKWKDQHKSAEGLLKWMTARRGSGESAIYVALLRGNRLAAEHKWDEAAAAYEPVRRDHPDDPQVRFRLAQLQFARGDVAAAASAATALAADRKAPTWIRAQSLLIVGRSHDLAGQRDAAKRAYSQIVDDFDKESAIWPARVGLVTAYRRR